MAEVTAQAASTAALNNIAPAIIGHSSMRTGAILLQDTTELVQQRKAIVKMLADVLKYDVGMFALGMLSDVLQSTGQYAGSNSK